MGKEITRAAGKSWQHRRMRGDDSGNKALPQMSNVSIMQQSTCYGRREDKQRYGDGGQRWWWMTMAADNYDTRDWVADCNG